MKIINVNERLLQNNNILIEKNILPNAFTTRHFRNIYHKGIPKKKEGN